MLWAHATRLVTCLIVASSIAIVVKVADSWQAMQVAHAVRSVSVDSCVPHSIDSRRFVDHQWSISCSVTSCIRVLALRDQIWLFLMSEVTGVLSVARLIWEVSCHVLIATSFLRVDIGLHRRPTVIVVLR